MIIINNDSDYYSCIPDPKKTKTRQLLTLEKTSIIIYYIVNLECLFQKVKITTLNSAESGKHAIKQISDSMINVQ